MLLSRSSQTVSLVPDEQFRGISINQQKKILPWDESQILSAKKTLKTKQNPPRKQKLPFQLVFKPANKHFHNIIWNKIIVLVHGLFSHLKPLPSSLQSICYSPAQFLSLSWTKSKPNNKLPLAYLFSNLSDVTITQKASVGDAHSCCTLEFVFSAGNLDCGF